MSRDVESVTVTLTNSLGLHARPIMKLVKSASAYTGSTIRVEVNGTERDAKSVLDLATLNAPCGIPITIRAEGDDASEAVATLKYLVETRFGETAVVVVFLDPACINVCSCAENREEVIRELLQLIEQRHGVTCAGQLLSTAMVKESRLPAGSAIGGGIAFPHALDRECRGVFAAMARLQWPIDWRADDEKPVDLVFLTVGRDKSSITTVMEDMSSVLASQSVSSQILSAVDAEEVHRAIVKEGDRLTLERAGVSTSESDSSGSSDY